MYLRAARNGQKFLIGLTQRESRNPQALGRRKQLYIYIYDIYIYIYTHMCVYIYIYIYICTSINK